MEIQMKLYKIEMERKKDRLICNFGGEESKSTDTDLKLCIS